MRFLSREWGKDRCRRSAKALTPFFDVETSLEECSPSLGLALGGGSAFPSVRLGEESSGNGPFKFYRLSLSRKMEEVQTPVFEMHEQTDLVELIDLSRVD